MWKNRCISKITKDRRRRCKCSARWSGHCYVHAIRHALCLQKIWRGCRVRKSLLVYERLPLDIQRIVIFYLREPLLLEWYHYMPLRRVIEPKLRKMQYPPYFPMWNLEREIRIKEMMYCYRLATKYLHILDPQLIATVAQMATHLIVDSHLYMTPMQMTIVNTFLEKWMNEFRSRKHGAT